MLYSPLELHLRKRQPVYMHKKLALINCLLELIWPLIIWVSGVSPFIFGIKSLHAIFLQ